MVMIQWYRSSFIYTRVPGRSNQALGIFELFLFVLLKGLGFFYFGRSSVCTSGLVLETGSLLIDDW